MGSGNANALLGSFCLTTLRVTTDQTNNWSVVWSLHTNMETHGQGLMSPLLYRCMFCDSQTYVLASEVIDSNGDLQPHYMSCAYCKGAGELDRWVDIFQLCSDCT
jgi:hypothetical protein